MKEYNLQIGNKTFKNGIHIMGILNATPDSFFSDSRVTDSDLIQRAEQMLSDGAAIIDLGGQSTRPGHIPVSAKEEISRLIPKVKELKKKTNALISIDTYYPEVAEACISEGADMINDVSMLEDKRLAKVVGDNKVSICLMHTRRKSIIDDLFEDKIKGLEIAVQLLLDSGVSKSKILLDGGIGFNRSNVEDWELLNNYEKLIEHFEYPFLLGTSMKSMFGGAIKDRLQPTIQTSLLAKEKGVLFVRVHDVKNNGTALGII